LPDHSRRPGRGLGPDGQMTFSCARQLGVGDRLRPKREPLHGLRGGGVADGVGRADLRAV